MTTEDQSVTRLVPTTGAKSTSTAMIVHETNNLTSGETTMNNSLMAVSPKIAISKQSSKDNAAKKPQNVTLAATDKENSKPVAVAA